MTSLPRPLPARPPAPRAYAVLGGVLLLGLVGIHGWVPFFGGVVLGTHEFGHLVTFWAPPLVTAAMGDVMQVALPLLLAGYFGVRRHELGGAALLLAWTAAAFADWARYVADAPYQLLPLFGGEDAVHDWAFVLGRLHALSSAHALSVLLLVAAWLVLAAGCVVALHARPRPARPSQAEQAMADELARVPSHWTGDGTT